MWLRPQICPGLAQEALQPGQASKTEIKLSPSQQNQGTQQGRGVTEVQVSPDLAILHITALP